jgi:predicted phosphodiesterase
MAKTKTKRSPLDPKAGNHLVVVLPDTHVPYEDKAALGCALHAIELLKPKKVLILGDFMDATAFSTHPPKTLAEVRAHDFHQDEIVPTQRYLDRIQKHSEELIYVEGNHEARIESCAARMGGSFSAVYNLVSPRTLLSANRKNFTWVPYQSEIAHYEIARDLWAFHGWSHGTHAAYNHLNSLRGISGIFGHIHRAQAYAVRNPVNGRRIQSWSPGCLAKLQPLWCQTAPNNWNHGFDLIYVKNDLSEWTNYTVYVQNGEAILPSGKTVRA